MENKVSYINQCSQIENEALDWLILLDGDEPPTPEQLADLKAWLQQSSQHQQALSELNQFWSDQALTELYVQVEPKKASKSQNYWMGSVAIAASLALVAFLSWFMPYQNSVEAIYSTAVGEQLTVQLADGSQLHLDTQSHIEVRFNDDVRDLYLKQGQVYFDVAKDKDRPFRVHAGSGRVEAIGTEFSIEVADGTLKLLVTEGIVAVAKSVSLIEEQRSEYVTLGAINAGNRYNIVASEEAEALKQNFNQQVIAVSDADIANDSAWVSGALVFNGDPLSMVVDKINKYSDKPLLIKDASITDIKIGGRFNVGDLDAFLNLLEASFAVKVEYYDHQYVLTSAH